MTKVTQEMIGAAHDVTMRHKIVLGHELLTEIYQAMNKKREFVGLTDKDAEDIERWVEFKEEGSGRIPVGKLVLYIEAKLREKNA